MKEKLKSKKLWMMLALLVAVAAVASPIIGNKNQAKAVSTYQLSKQKLVNTVNVSGTVESADSVDITTSLGAYDISSVDVKVGDRVTAGQLLGTVDVEDLRLDIAKVENNLNTSIQNANLNVSSAQKEYDALKADLDNNMNPSIVNAQATFDSALTQLNDAKKDYNNALIDLDEGENETIKKAQDAVDDARDNYHDALDAIEEMDDTIDNLEDKISDIEAQIAMLDPSTNPDEIKYLVQKKGELQSQLMQLNASNNTESASDRAYDAYEDAKENLKDAVKKADKELENYLKAVEKAQTGFDNADKSLRLAQKSAMKQLDDLQDKITSTKINANTASTQIELQKLRKQLAEAEITSPIDGVVTEIKAEVGHKANGVLFVIENDEALQVVASIKEYDLMKVKEGQKATIKTDATEDAVYNGEVSFIAPSAIKKSEGATGSTSVEFETKVNVTDKDTLLRIGLTARVDIVLDQKENVFAVPFDAILIDETGQPYVLVATAEKNGNYVAKRVNVTQGMETDFMVEIFGEGLNEGDLIIGSAEGINEGEKVTLVE